MLHNAFYFKMRMSSSDWDMLSQIMVRDNPFYTRKAQRDWFFNQINRLCREVAMPLLAIVEPSELVEKTIYVETRAFDSSFIILRAFASLHEPPLLVEKQVLIQEISFAGSTNIGILRAFAALKHTTITQIIQKYIVDSRIISEEKVRARRYREAMEMAMA